MEFRHYSNEHSTTFRCDWYNSQYLGFFSKYFVNNKVCTWLMLSMNSLFPACVVCHWKFCIACVGDICVFISHVLLSYMYAKKSLQCWHYLSNFLHKSAPWLQGVVVNFDLGEQFPRPRSQQRVSLHPRTRRVAMLGVSDGFRGITPGKFFQIFDAKSRVWGKFGPENKLIEGHLTSMTWFTTTLQC